MTERPTHFCPGCGTEQRHFARYPWYFCQSCLKTATAGDGRALTFGNVSPMSGGLSWSFADEDVFYEEGTVLCFIRGRPALVSEARFGGVVAQPIWGNSVGIRPFNLVDLRKGVVSERPLRPMPKNTAPPEPARPRRGRIVKRRN